MQLDDTIFSRNETLRSIRDRHSVRTFTGDDVTDEEIRVLLHAANAAPSAHNQQAWRFIVLKGGKKQELAQLVTSQSAEFPRPAAALLRMGAKSIISAPVVIAVANTGDLIRHGTALFKVEQETAHDFFRTMEIQSSAAAVENILLAATSLGLGCAGVGPTRIDRVVGVIKAYTTRVGEGPFPTELNDDRGEWLRKTGGEYGVTTGRPRRCGWYDAVVARYSGRINGLTDLVLTKLDVLTGLEKVPVCVAYDVAGRRFDEMPSGQSDFHHATPVFEELDGWWEDISECRTFEDLPANAQRYVLALEEMSGTRISAIGVGPGRDATIVRHELLP